MSGRDWINVALATVGATAYFVLFIMLLVRIP